MNCIDNSKHCLTMRMARNISLPIFLFLLISIKAVESSPQCIDNGFVPDSHYKGNSHNILSSLVSKVMAARGFYKDSFGQDSNIVYAMGMCITRGEPTLCSDCLRAATDELKSCPNQAEAYTWRSAHNAHCFARYSNRSFLGTPDLEIEMHPVYREFSSQEIKTDLTLVDFENKKWKPFTERLVAQASFENNRSLPNRKYYAIDTEVLTTFQTIYGLMQCTPDLPRHLCTECLRKSIEEHSYPNSSRGRQGGIIAWPRCFFRWDMQPFSEAFDPVVPCSKNISVAVFLAAVVPTVFTSFVLAAVVVILVSRRRKSNPPPDSPNDIPTTYSLQYDLKTVQAATCTFSKSNKLGEGGFGEVFKGLLQDGSEIAVKRLSKESAQGVQEFKNETSLVNIPDVVVFPRSEEEVSQILKSCNKYKVPIVPYGGATSIEGHTLAPKGGVCIDMSLMKRVKALHVEDMDVVVEPGIGWIELNEQLEQYGLFFPLDPGPGATIGGMCATRCSGSLAVRYGTMRDNVISLKVVLPNGDVVKTASRARKSAAGYDLTRLIIGSEGTLGVITEVTLRLQKIPQHSVVAVCNFPTVKDAADVAIATMLSGIQVSRVELLDEVQIRAINMANGKNLIEAPTLMFEFIGTEAYAREQTQIVQQIASKHNGTDFMFAEEPEAKKELWKIRKEALWANFAMAPGHEAMTTDVCVPLSHLAEIISISKKELDASPLLCTVIAHAGDGNFHTCIMFDPDNEEHRREAERLNHFMVHAALSMGGTCTGEHGVGTGKMKYLEKELGMEALQTMKKIKKALDPNDIMNPGKLIPPHVCF